MVERRPYFVLGDLISCAGTGGLVGLVTGAVVGPEWHGVVGLAVGVVMGMIIALALGLTALQILFGAIEVVLPVTLTGALVGMWIGVIAAGADVSSGWSASAGASLGLGVMVFSYALNAHLTRRPRHG
jgi:prepilin signal peptidase PulO-like enzyme (type II secretory pathway)